MGTRTRPGPETIVCRWVDAFNARDIEGMLARLSEQVDFRPLRLNGCEGSYQGHDGVRVWWTQLRRGRIDHQIVLSETRRAGDGQVFASGSLTVDGESDFGSFCALHTVDDGLIVAAHQYLSDADLIERLGLLR